MRVKKTPTTSKILQMRDQMSFILILISLLLFSCTPTEDVKENQIVKRIEFSENAILTEVKNYDKVGKIIEHIGYDTNYNIMWRSIYKYNKKGEKIKSINFQKGNIFSGETEFIYNDGKDMGYISSNSEGTKLRFINSYNNDNLIASYEVTPNDKIIKYTTYVYDSAYRISEENEYAISYSDLENTFPQIQTAPWTTKKILRDSTGQIVRTSFLKFHGVDHPLEEIHCNYDNNGNIIESSNYQNKENNPSEHFIYFYTNDELTKKIDVLKNDSIIYSKKEKIFER